MLFQICLIWKHFNGFDILCEKITWIKYCCRRHIFSIEFSIIFTSSLILNLNFWICSKAWNMTWFEWYMCYRIFEKLIRNWIGFLKITILKYVIHYLFIELDRLYLKVWDLKSTDYGFYNLFSLVFFVFGETKMRP